MSDNQTQNNKKLLLVIIAIAAVFLIVIIVFGILILGKLGKNDSANVSDNTPAQTESAETEDTVVSEDTDAETESADTESEDAESIEESDASPESEEVEAELEESTDAIAEYLAERFPRLTEAYVTPKTENSVWIPLDDEARAKLDALDSDYNKVSWIVEYAFRSLPSLVVSYAINENCGVPYVFVAFTNIGDKALSIDGTADIFDFDKTHITAGYPYIGLLQPGGDLYMSYCLSGY